MLTAGGIAGAPIRKAWIGKLTYVAATDSYVDQEVKCAAYNDGAALRYWARQVPNPGAAGLIIDSYPTDADPNFRYHVAGQDTTGTYTQTITITITRRSTGTGPASSGLGYWASDGGQEWYDVVVYVQNTKENALPAVFDAYQQPSDTAGGTSTEYQDPRAAA